VAAPVVETDPGLTQVLPRVEVTERLVLPVAAAVVAAMPAPVAVEPSQSAPSVTPKEETETRPEPVVLRASQRPPAMPEPLSVLPPPVRELAPAGTTPVLGTVVAPSPVPEPLVAQAPLVAAEPILAEEPRLSVAELAEALATPVPPADDELELDVEVTFSEDERTVTPDDVELILLGEDGAEMERTEPCPSPAAESMLPPAVAVAAPSDAVAAVSDIELPDDVLASAPGASPVEEAPEPGTVLPPWVTARPEQEELSPLPHVAVPRARESNVDDLLERMTRESADVDELRSGLKSLAGLEPTPPPPGSFSGD
jgi:hypothetical protein